MATVERKNCFKLYIPHVCDHVGLKVLSHPVKEINEQEWSFIFIIILFFSAHFYYKRAFM